MKKSQPTTGSDAKALRAGAPEEPGNSAPELFMSPGQERRGRSQSSAFPPQHLREERGKKKIKKKLGKAQTKPQ